MPIPSYANAARRSADDAATLDGRRARDLAQLNALGLRASRRLLASCALLACGLLKEFPAPVIGALLFVCWAEHWLPAHKHFAEAAFQRIVSYLCYLTLPFFLAIFLAYETPNPFHDALIGFLVFFQLKWVYAPRSDFHWIAALLLFCLVVARTQSVLFAAALLGFLVLSLPYLAGLQDIAALPETPRRYLRALGQRRRGRVGALGWAPLLAGASALFFLLLPRSPAPGLGYGAGNYVNLTDQVALHKDSDIKQDYKVVGRFRLLSGQDATPLSPANLYLRAGCLEGVRESDWTFFRSGEPPARHFRPARGRGRTERQPWRLEVSDYAMSQARASFAEERYRLTIVDPAMTYFVRLPGAWEVEMAARLNSLGNEFYALEKANFPLALDGQAFVPPNVGDDGWPVFPQFTPAEQRDQLRRVDASEQNAFRRLVLWPGSPIAGGSFDPALRQQFDILRRLADQWLAPVPPNAPNAAKAAVVAANLRARYRYDLNPPRPNLAESDNPLLPFLLIPELNRGHCEMFAGSMVALLRAKGVPCRLANGFRGAEPDPTSGDWIVRRSNAHTWVEVWDDRAGWLAFDPTPSQPFQSYEGRIYYKAVKSWYDDVERAWLRDIVSYDYASQRQLLDEAATWAKSAGAALASRAEKAMRPYGWLKEKIAGSVALTRAFWAFMAFQLLVAVVAVVRWASQPRRRAERRGLDLFWGNVERALGARREGKRLVAETYREALGRLLPARSERLDPAIEADLLAYMEERAYGGGAVDERRQIELLARLEAMLERSRKTTWPSTASGEARSPFAATPSGGGA